MPPNRLVSLLKQAYSYQASQTCPSTPRSMRVVSLLEDISGSPLPAFLADCQQRVEGPVKGVAALSAASVAFSSRNALFVWNREAAADPLKRVGAHNGLIWNLQVNPLSQEVVTAGSDGLVKIWSPGKDTSPIELSVSQNDVYAVCTHPLNAQLIAAGCFDGSVQIFDSEQRACLKVGAPRGCHVEVHAARRLRHRRCVQSRGESAVFGGKGLPHRDVGCGERVRAGRAGSESEGDYGAGERGEREFAGGGEPKRRG